MLDTENNSSNDTGTSANAPEAFIKDCLRGTLCLWILMGYFRNPEMDSLILMRFRTKCRTEVENRFFSPPFK